ncbi:MAG TPA: hypothetical protein VD994_02380 [Prosthecobacter sp.]|nr:hypothetical protein [Prosthecobacter sp.]
MSDTRKPEDDRAAEAPGVAINPWDFFIEAIRRPFKPKEDEELERMWKAGGDDEPSA